MDGGSSGCRSTASEAAGTVAAAVAAAAAGWSTQLPSRQQSMCACEWQHHGCCDKSISGMSRRAHARCNSRAVLVTLACALAQRAVILQSHPRMPECACCFCIRDHRVHVSTSTKQQVGETTRLAWLPIPAPRGMLMAALTVHGVRSVRVTCHPPCQCSKLDAHNCISSS